jgi:hypothetical protein
MVITISASHSGERCEQVGLDMQRDTQARLGFANEVHTRSILHGALTH